MFLFLLQNQSKAASKTVTDAPVKELNLAFLVRCRNKDRMTEPGVCYNILKRFVDSNSCQKMLKAAAGKRFTQKRLQPPRSIFAAANCALGDEKRFVTAEITAMKEGGS